MQVITSTTLTVLHDGQFWVGIFEHADEGRYGACRVVFGATEPTDTELLAFVCARWTQLPFSLAADPAQGPDAALSHANPKRRQREARKLVERAGVGTKAQQAMSASYEQHKEERKGDARERRRAEAEHKEERKGDARERRRAEAERQFALKQQKRKEKHRGR
ncbi:YjdF family protein [Eggerthella sinensis]|uniref:YjdF family protein n=1 Tax=Eggerthella sinensis TaxID=242230 RepID=UPI0022E3BD0E|nr:YjdF family protein [Eggerthella sinensis]